MRIWETVENRAETMRCLAHRIKEMNLLQAPNSHSETFLFSFVGYNFMYMYDNFFRSVLGISLGMDRWMMPVP